MLNNDLLTALSETAGCSGDIPVHVLQCSSAMDTGAIVFHLFEGGAEHPTAVAKTARQPQGRESLAREWENVRIFAEFNEIRRYMPSPLGVVEADGASFYVYRGLPGQTQFARFRNRILGSKHRLLLSFGAQALRVAVPLHATSSRLIDGADVATQIRDEFARLQSLTPDIPAVVTDRLHAAAALVAERDIVLPAGRIHGDFSPYNMLADRRTGAIGLIDWEHGETDRVQILDILRFIGGCAMIDLFGSSYPAVFRNMSSVGNPLLDVLLKPWAASLGVQRADRLCDPDVLDALWLFYWIHAAYREQTRSREPADYSRGCYIATMTRLLGS